MASYPGAIKNFLVLEDGVDKVIAAHPNDRAAEITAIETELGIDVAGSAADLVTRLAVALNDDGTPKTVLGAWVNKSASYGAQVAATDGFVVAYNHNSNGANPGGDVTSDLVGWTDVNANPTTIRAISSSVGGTTNIWNQITFPVKKGDYWKVTIGSGAVGTIVWWIPLGI